MPSRGGAGGGRSSGGPRRVGVAVPNGSPFVPAYTVPGRLPLPPVGARVAVPFGSAVLAGVVVSVDPPPSADGVTERPIFALLDETPFVPAPLASLLPRAAAYYAAPPGELLRAAVPPRFLDPGRALYVRTAPSKGTAEPAAPTGRAERAVLAALEALEAPEAGDPGGPSAAGADTQTLAREVGSKGLATALRSLLAAGLVTLRPETLSAGAAPTEVRWEAIPSPDAPGLLVKRPRRRAVWEALSALGRPAPASDVPLRAAGATGPILSSLAADGLARRLEVPRRADLELHVGLPLHEAPVVPTAEQASAIAAIAAAVRSGAAEEFLLDGVTGSGKTEVYLASLEEARRAGRQGILLVPEIALVPALVRRILGRFGDRVSLIHSALGEAERASEWERARRGEVDAVVGPRSAVFAPLPRLGLIVVDEAHEASYKQAEAPRYDARDLARSRARAERAVLVLGTATPAMEHEKPARDGRLRRLSLPARPGARRRAEVEVVDVRGETPRAGDHGRVLFARRTVEILSGAFERGEQAILLLNRRGFSPSLLCRACGEDFRCPRCSVARTYHRRGEHLLCHYCADSVPRPADCPKCGGGPLQPVGFGTERLEERFAELFPGVSFAVLDRDAAARRGGAASVLADFESGRARALLGTQMVAKGHDFPNATALAVLDADALLSFPDFRASERTFQLVTQAAGRVGRGERPGTVAVQTARPDHEAIQCAVRQDHVAFADSELAFRRAFRYPPYALLLLALWSGDDASRAESGARAGHAALAEAFAGTTVRLLGPAPAPIERIKGLWRFHLLVKATRREEIAKAARILGALKEPPRIDVDPQNML